MRLFQSSQRDFVILGIGPYDPTQKNQFNKNIFLYLFLCVLSLILTGAFLVFEADTFEEYTEGIYMFSASILSPLAAVSIAIKVQTLFTLIKRCENMLDASK